MFRSLKNTSKMTIHATDGPIGKIDEFYFDDENWAIRYIVADIGSWVTGKRILLSPASVAAMEDDRLVVKNGKEQIKKSPDVDATKPVSRQHEIELHDYYAWPYYWIYPSHYNSLGGAIYPGITSPSGYPHPTEEESMEEEAKKKESEGEEMHLRSSREVTGYHIQATDEEIGHVYDFLIDDEAWAIRYLIIDTRNVIPGKKVVVAPQWIKGIDWGDAEVYVDYSRETIKNGPEYDPNELFDRDFEKRIYNYYDRPPYWTEK
jgi:uncharacterized protein YrrD